MGWANSNYIKNSYLCLQKNQTNDRAKYLPCWASEWFHFPPLYFLYFPNFNNKHELFPNKKNNVMKYDKSMALARDMI